MGKLGREVFISCLMPSKFTKKCSHLHPAFREKRTKVSRKPNQAMLAKRTQDPSDITDLVLITTALQWGKWFPGTKTLIPWRP